MNIHSLARTTPPSRGLIADRRDAGIPEAVLASQLGIDRKTVRKWAKRKRDEGEKGLHDRSSRPHHSPTALPPEWRAAVDALRRLRFTQEQIADVLELSKSRVQRTVASLGLAKLKALEPPMPENRYERSRAGELVHVDIKKLARFYQPGHRVTGDRSDTRLRGRRGWEFLHVAIDDRTRLAYAELLPDEKGERCADFLRRAARFFSRHGIGRIERVMMGLIHSRGRSTRGGYDGAGWHEQESGARIAAAPKVHRASSRRAPCAWSWTRASRVSPGRTRPRPDRIGSCVGGSSEHALTGANGGKHRCADRPRSVSELAQLRKENRARCAIERDILKKAAAFFAKETT